MQILISNDDGVHAKGINILAQRLTRLAIIHIVAPDRNRSGASNSLTLSAPLRIQRLEDNRISVEGTPTDCVHLAITGLMEKQPDMVVAGINEGANLGDDTLYSGTVAAAIEGRFLGLPAIAVSLAGTQCEYYDTAAEVTARLVKRLVDYRLPAYTILNVNVPDVPYDELKGWEVTRLGRRHKAEPIIQQKDPRGQPIYWIGPAGPAEDAGPGTDFYAVNEHKVSITPLQVDLTQYSAFDQLSRCLVGIIDE